MSEELPFTKEERKIDLMAEFAKEKFNLAADWRIFRWECFPKSADKCTHVMVTGAVCNAVICSGKRAGQTNWDKRDKTTEFSLPVVIDDFEKWKPEWEKKSGKCWVCLGTGQRWIGWHHIDGDKYQPCKRCLTTGKPPGGAK